MGLSRQLGWWGVMRGPVQGGELNVKRIDSGGRDRPMREDVTSGGHYFLEYVTREENGLRAGFKKIYG
jgi:hypothetical protein